MQGGDGLEDNEGLEFEIEFKIVPIQERMTNFKG